MRRIVSLSKQIQINFCSNSETVQFQKNNYLVKVILNKPKALNSLDLNMIRNIQSKIQQWVSSNTKAVWIQGAGGKAFCAGGDIRSLYDAKIQKNPENQQIFADFFKEEFLLDYTLANMKPTQIAVMDGIVMGGGVGISVHAPIKIATENSVFAMPEARIGFFTDVGGGYFLSRLRNNIGLYLGLTGARLKGKELVASGIANYYVESGKLQNLESEIGLALKENSNAEDIHNIVIKYSDNNILKTLNNEDLIKSLFSANSLQGILQNVELNQSEFGKSTLKLLSQQNSISLRVIFEQIQRGKNLTLKENFISDYRLTQRFLQGNDFFEGVRTVLIDRNDQPKWTYKNPSEVPESLLEEYFKPLLPEQELKL